MPARVSSSPRRAILTRLLCTASLLAASSPAGAAGANAQASGFPWGRTVRILVGAALGGLTAVAVRRGADGSGSSAAWAASGAVAGGVADWLLSTNPYPGYEKRQRRMELIPLGATLGCALIGCSLAGLVPVSDGRARDRSLAGATLGASLGYAWSLPDRLNRARMGAGAMGVCTLVGAPPGLLVGLAIGHRSVGNLSNDALVSIPVTMLTLAVLVVGSARLTHSRLWCDADGPIDSPRLAFAAPSTAFGDDLSPPAGASGGRWRP